MLKKIKIYFLPILFFSLSTVFTYAKDKLQNELKASTPSWVGKVTLLNKANFFCNGSALSPYLIISAAHCFYPDFTPASNGNINDIKARLSKDIIFYLKSQTQTDHKYVGKVIAIGDWYHKWLDFKFADNLDEIKAAKKQNEQIKNEAIEGGGDWAIILLEKPIATNITYPKLNFQPINILKEQKKLYFSSHSFYTNEGFGEFTTTGPCQVDNIFSETLLLPIDCAIFEGFSGGPAFYNDNHQNILSGVISGRLIEGNQHRVTSLAQPKKLLQDLINFKSKKDILKYIKTSESSRYLLDINRFNE